MERYRAPEMDFHFADGVFVKHIVIVAKGFVVPQHSHQYDHTSFIASGEVMAWKDGRYIGRFTAPSGVKIEAGCKHTFLTTADNTVLLCIHNLHGEGAVRVLAEHELTPEDALAFVQAES